MFHIGVLTPSLLPTSTSEGVELMKTSCDLNIVRVMHHRQFLIIQDPCNE
jgi:hypothetical protein